MASLEVAAYIHCFTICTLLTLAWSLSLGSPTPKPRQTKYSSSTATPASGSLVTPTNAPVTPASGVSLYRVKATSGSTCILLQTDALIEINFNSHSIGDEKGDTYMPDLPNVEGICRDEDEETMVISWNGYTLILSFSKTPGGERWYISDVKLTVVTSLPPYTHLAEKYGSQLVLVQSKNLIPTPVGKSYSCEETEISLYVREGQPNPYGVTGTLFLRTLKVQPFMYKGNNFGPEFDCNTAMSFRDETTPIAVGSTLAIAVLLTVTGYGVFRYFKIKKVQYNTME